MVHTDHFDFGPEFGLRPGQRFHVALDAAGRGRVELAEVTDAERTARALTEELRAWQSVGASVRAMYGTPGGVV